MVDAQLPSALAQLLASHGHSAEHVEDIGLLEADDTDIWNYALQNAAVIVTKDQDFPHRHGQSHAAPDVLWLRIGNTSRRALLEWLEPLLTQIEELIEDSDGLVELR